MRKRPLKPSPQRMLICAILFAYASSTGLAEEAISDHSVGMPPLVVTATRDVRAEATAPYATGLINADVLRLENATRSMPEALKFEPGTMIQKTAHGQGSPYIRGFTSQRNLLMIDGIRLNNSVFREGPNQYWNTVDPFGLHQVELVRGPFSTLYGSDAVGGTINAITRGVRDLRPESDWDRRLYYRYSTAEKSHIGRAETIKRLTEDLTLTLGYTAKDFGNVEGGRSVGTQPKTGYGEIDWDAKLEYFLDDNTYLVLAHQDVGIDDAWRTHKTIYGINWEGLSVGSEYRRVLDQDRELTYLQYHALNRDGIVGEIHAGISHHLQTEERDRLRSRDRHDVQGFDVNTLGAFVTLKSPSAIGTLVYGIEAYHDDVDSFRRSLDTDGTVRSTAIQGPVGDDATYDSLGAFIQDEIAVTERLSLLIGGRYEYAEADADSVEDPETGDPISVTGDWNDVVGSARARYTINTAGTWVLFAGVSQGFRAPNLSDLTRLDAARTDEIETPSPDLDPEHFVSAEVGIKAETARLSAQLACFYTDIDNMIVRTPTGRIVDGDREVTKQNGGDGYVQGVEFDARCNLGGNVTAFGVCTWMEGEVDTYPTSDPIRVRESITRQMPLTGRAGLRWAPTETLWLETACSAAAKADTLNTRDRSDTSRIPSGGTPAYTVADIRAGWNCADGLSITLAIENITDEDYRIHGSGLNEPGRNVILATDWVF
jgi:hemoglobin/transferrin/lactoferrin receptor protein